MMLGNQTMITEFVLLGFGDVYNLKILLLLSFLLIYIVTITGNILIMTLIVLNQHLHTPMYFFLGNLSTLEACYSSSIWPRMLGFTVFFILLTLVLQQLTFCDPNVIDHYFCDFLPLIKLSCSNTSMLEILSFIVAATFVFLPFLVILTSYIYIIAAILKIPSTTGRQKAFSTCSSHLVVVSIFYGSLIVVYMFPKTEDMQGMGKLSSLLYTVLPPLITPFIYSLRNKDVKNALKILLAGLCYVKQMS
ncbi:olfactory receptor 1E16-like [Tiliqua scincoides]|uniref:olfactory receptor 1E16-like n=1 Tax=Tiliqua scincoides TaxID=71010 RepID=UPI0034618152